MAFLTVKGPVTGEAAMVDVDHIVAVVPSYTEGKDGKLEAAGAHIVIASGDSIHCANSTASVMAAVERISGEPALPVEVN